MRIAYEKPVNEMPVTESSVKDSVSAYMLPKLLVDKDRHKMWHAMSNVKSESSLTVRVGFVFKSKYSMLSAKNSAVMNVFNKLVCCIASTSLKEALDTEIRVGMFITHVWGYSEKIEYLMMSVIQQIVRSSFDQALLDTAKESCKDTLEHQFSIVKEADRYFEGDGYTEYLLNTGHYLPCEIVEHVDAITVDDVLQCANAFFGSATLDVLVYGNICSDEALAMYKRAVDVIARRYPQRDVFEFDVKRIQNIQPILYKLRDDQEQCIYISLLIDKDSPRIVLLWKLFITTVTSLEYTDHFLTSPGCINSYIELTYCLSSSKKSVLTLYNKINALFDANANIVIQLVQKRGLSEFKRFVAYDLMNPNFSNLIYKITDVSYNFKDMFEWRELLEQITEQEFVDFLGANLIKPRYNCVMKVDRRKAADLDKLRTTDDNGTQRVLVELNAKSIAEWRHKYTLASDLESKMSIS